MTSDAPAHLSDGLAMHDAVFRRVDLSRAHFEHTYFSEVTMRGVELVDDVDIDGEVERLTINGVDVAPLVEAELDRRDPDRVRMRPDDTPGIPRDRAVRPSLEDALALRLDRMALVREVVDGLTEDSLAAETAPPVGPGWPPEGMAHPVKSCLRTVLNEEFQHRRFAERDLDVLESRAP